MPVLFSTVPPNPDLGRPVVVSDFDGTLTRHDLGALTLERFGTPGWERYDELFENGEITIAECIRKQSAMIRARSQKEILRYISGFSRFRPGFVQLLNECRRGGVEFVVASAGIDFCIRQVFRLNELPMPRLYCPVTTFTRTGLRVEMPPRPRIRRNSGLPISRPHGFKEALVASYRSRGRRVVYLGDGVTDLPAAAIASKVFAIRGSRLERGCLQRGIPCASIRTLLPVSQFLRVDRTSR